MAGFFTELKRRNIFRVGIAYAVVSWLILQISDVILNNIEAPEWLFQAIMLVLAIGFPVILLFAWAFEMTPDGIKRESEIDRTQSITHVTGRKLDFTIIGALVIAAGYFFWESRISESSPQVVETVDTSTSIAVLPFVNMSSDPEQEYFSDGISEEILNVLAHIPGLHVTSRSSAFQFKGENIDIPTVAAQLEVAHVLEGSVRKSGERVRITAQLIEASTDKHLWSETYDREVTDIFAVQDEISLAIVDALKTALNIDIEAPTATSAFIDTAAHNEFLMGVYQMEQRKKEPLEAAIAHFEKAIEIEPDYAAAIARLSMTLNLLPGYVSGLEEADYVPLARPHADQAMELDPDGWEANLAMGYQIWLESGPKDAVKLEDAIPYLEKALELNPSYGTTYAWLAGVMRSGGDIDGSLETLEAGIEVAPLDRILLNHLSGGYIRRGRYEEAQAIIDRLMNVAPSMAFDRMAHLATAQGRWADNAIALVQDLAFAPASSNYWARRIVGDDLGLAGEAMTIGEEDSYYGLYVYQMNPAGAHRWVERHMEKTPSIGRTYGAGSIYASLGDMQKAHELMEQAWSEFDHSNPIYPAPAHVAARRAMGDEDGVREFVQKTEEFIKFRQDAGIVSNALTRDLGIIYYLAGEREKALPLIKQSFENGLFVRTFHAYHAELTSDPELADMFARQEAKTEMERARFLTIMCGDENPVLEYWKPSEAACSLLNVEAIK
jgi:TolB-like protein